MYDALPFLETLAIRARYAWSEHVLVLDVQGRILPHGVHVAVNHLGSHIVASGSAESLALPVRCGYARHGLRKDHLFK